MIMRFSSLLSALSLFVGVLYLPVSVSSAQTTESAWINQVSQELSHNDFRIALSDARFATAQYP